MRFEHAAYFALLTVTTLMTACSRATPPSAPQPDAIAYPESRVVEHIDTYHGVEVADPFRWLEADVRESDAVSAWVDAQNEVTFAYLEKLPGRDRIEQRLRELWDFERYGLPRKRGDRYFYSYNDGLQNQSVIYTLERLDGEPALLIDPNAWSDDGTVALAAYYPSPDARYVAYLVQDGGSDWRTARVLDIESGAELADELEWLKFTPLAWAADGSGFYYSRYPETDDDERFQSLNTNHSVYFHRLGNAQAEDRLVYTDPANPEWGYNPEVSDDGRWLVITVWKGTDERYQVLYRDLEDPDGEPVFLVEGFDYDYTFIGSVGDDLYFRTSRDAPRGRIVAANVAGDITWREIVPQSDEVLTNAGLVGGRIIGEYLQDAWTVVRLFEGDGTAAGEIDLPGIGTADGFSGRWDDPETFYSYESFNQPPTIHRYDVATGESEIFRQPGVPFDPDDYVVEQVFYRSKDGTRVPMFLAYRAGTERNGDQPTLLYGYGGFNVSLTPGFSTSRLAWMEMGGVYAVANLRGGGEYGEEWHKAGTRLEKQNVFDDFIAAAEFLIDEGYTNPERLAIFGGSNGGLLVGAVTNQRPDLFAAAVPAVGVMDMLRFQEFTAGRFWVDDYGSSADPEEFSALYAYSPYHNIREGLDYPAVLITTADTDDRVVPGHSFKYAARLQQARTGDEPTLIRIETRAGHGAGKPTEMIIEEYADRWAFVAHHVGMRLPEGYGSD